MNLRSSMDYLNFSIGGYFIFFCGVYLRYCTPLFWAGYLIGTTQAPHLNFLIIILNNVLFHRKVNCFDNGLYMRIHIQCDRVCLLSTLWRTLELSNCICITRQLIVCGTLCSIFSFMLPVFISCGFLKLWYWGVP